MNAAHDWLVPLLGQTLAGGCPDCPAEAHVERDADGIFRLLIEHEESCPVLVAKIGKPARRPSLCVDCGYAVAPGRTADGEDCCHDCERKREG